MASGVPPKDPLYRELTAQRLALFRNALGEPVNFGLVGLDEMARYLTSLNLQLGPVSPKMIRVWIKHRNFLAWRRNRWAPYQTTAFHVLVWLYTEKVL